MTKPILSEAITTQAKYPAEYKVLFDKMAADPAFVEIVLENQQSTNNRPGDEAAFFHYLLQQIPAR